MIKFSLACTEGHAFESWFQSGAAFDALAARGMVTCPDCGSTDVAKTLMAPAVSPARKAARADKQARLQALRAEIEAQSDYVGDRFATEARAMYLGDIPDRPIYGEAPLSEAKALLDEGVPVLPLPFTPSRKTS